MNQIKIGRKYTWLPDCVSQNIGEVICTNISETHVSYRYEKGNVTLLLRPDGFSQLIGVFLEELEPSDQFSDLVDLIEEVELC